MIIVINEYFQDQKESLIGGKFRVIGDKTTRSFNGIRVPVVYIEQISE